MLGTIMSSPQSLMRYTPARRTRVLVRPERAAAAERDSGSHNRMAETARVVMITTSAFGWSADNAGRGYHHRRTTVVPQKRRTSRGRKEQVRGKAQPVLGAKDPATASRRTPLAQRRLPQQPVEAQRGCRRGGTARPRGASTRDQSGRRQTASGSQPILGLQPQDGRYHRPGVGSPVL